VVKTVWIPIRVLILLVILGSNSLLTPHAWACASCGSGGDDPLILYPSEQWKIYSGVGLTQGFRPVDAQGRYGKETAVEQRQTTTLSVGGRLSLRSFVTVTIPHVINRRGSKNMSGFGDAMITGHYTIVNPDISRLWLPQVQVVGALKQGRATSIYDYKDPAKLDVLGNGVPEGRLGLDIWQGMTNWKLGFAQTMTIPLESRETPIGEYAQGPTFRATVTAGYGLKNGSKLIAGINRTRKWETQLDRQELPQSDVVNLGYFVTGAFNVKPQTTVRFTLSSAAAFAGSYNTNGNQTYAVALMRAL
jgi:hypothetical protein